MTTVRQKGGSQGTEHLQDQNSQSISSQGGLQTPCARRGPAHLGEAAHGAQAPTTGCFSNCNLEDDIETLKKRGRRAPALLRGIPRFTYHLCQWSRDSPATQNQNCISTVKTQIMPLATPESPQNEKQIIVSSKFSQCRLCACGECACKAHS